MRIVAALGGNALLRRGEPPTARRQRDNVQLAAAALAPLASVHELIVTHGNGPQVGLLALQGEACKADETYPLDMLDAETEGMIGYLVEQELANRLGDGKPVATLLTRVEVDPDDLAFAEPNKPIGPVYDSENADRLAREHGWTMMADGKGFRRTVPSPEPMRLMEIGVIRLLVGEGVVTVCAGGGGIPVTRRPDGTFKGVEAVIDKDRVSALLALELEADALLMLTDVDAVYAGWGEPHARPIRRAAPEAIARLPFAEGSMKPKIEAGCAFAEKTGGIAGIGRLSDAAAILRGEAGTAIAADMQGIAYRED